jgi:hypothetical protein
LRPSGSKKKLLFATYRDPTRVNNYEIINYENSSNTMIDLSGKKKKQVSDFNNFENEDDFIIKENMRILL